MNQSNDHIARCFKNAIQERQDGKPRKELHNLSKYANMKPEDIGEMFNTRSGIKEIRKVLSHSEKGKEIYDTLKCQKVRSILRNNQIERVFTGDDLYKTLNKEENFELLSELIGEEKTEAARQKAKRLGKQAIMLKKLGRATLVLTSYMFYTGTMLAMIISWSISHSVFWAITHGLLSWLYVINFMVQ